MPAGTTSIVARRWRSIRAAVRPVAPAPVATVSPLGGPGEQARISPGVARQTAAAALLQLHLESAARLVRPQHLAAATHEVVAAVLVARRRIPGLPVRPRRWLGPFPGPHAGKTRGLLPFDPLHRRLPRGAALRQAVAIAHARLQATIGLGASHSLRLHPGLVALAPRLGGRDAGAGQ